MLGLSLGCASQRGEIVYSPGPSSLSANAFSGDIVGDFLSRTDRTISLDNSPFSKELKYVPLLGYVDGTTCEVWPRDIEFFSPSSDEDNLAVLLSELALLDLEHLETLVPACWKWASRPSPQSARNTASSCVAYPGTTALTEASWWRATRSR